MRKTLSSSAVLAGARCGHEAVLVQRHPVCGLRQQFKVDFEVLAVFESKVRSQSGS